MTSYQIGISKAFWVYNDSASEQTEVVEEMICLRYWYVGTDPALDKERRHVPPPPPRPPF